MRLGSLAFFGLLACNQAQQDCAPAPEASALFAAALPADAGAEITAAVEAGRAVEAAASAAETFDEKIRTIAKDPALSEKWSAAVKVSGSGARTAASTARVAADLPQQTSRLRSAGVSTADVAQIVDASVRGRVTTDELAAALAVAADAVEAHGPIDDLGLFLSERLARGLRGEALDKAVKAEHEERGAKVVAARDADKVTVCHKPSGDDSKAKTLEIGASALDAHLGHGDTEGACDEEGEKGSDKSKSAEKSADKSKSSDKAPAGKGTEKASEKSGTSSKGAEKSSDKGGSSSKGGSSGSSGKGATKK